MLALLGCSSPVTSGPVPIVAGSMAPIVNGTINGRPARLLVDTGSNDTIVSSTFLQEPDNHAVGSLTVCLGGWCATHPAWAWDTPFSSPDPSRPTGLVGLDVLAGWVVVLDRLTSVAIGTSGSCGAGVPITFNPDGQPVVSVQVDGQAAPFLLDSGAAFSLLGAVRAAGLPYLDGAAQPADGCTVMGCTGGFKVSTVHQLCLAGVCASDVPVKYPQWDAVGCSFLGQHRTVFDFRANRVSVCP